GTHYHFTTLFGEPASEIARLTNELDANYIIMSTHGRTGLKKWMLGSVAQRVTERAKCPVILLPSTWVESQSDSINSMAVAI
ncbi:MAG: universal stress protein, partial [Planctomycetaceae bacterium]|nr:universal stress protein [Planctomycetaceae bacterium]